MSQRSKSVPLRPVAANVDSDRDSMDELTLGQNAKMDSDANGVGLKTDLTLNINLRTRPTSSSAV